MKAPIPKLKAMIRFFASNTDLRLLGKKKLMKLFYFTDFGHVKKYASPITYDTYIHLEHGPVPSTILNLISSVETDLDHSLLGDALSVQREVNNPLRRIVPTEAFSEKDAEYFTKSELLTMKEVCARFATATGRFIEARSHEESAWVNTDELDEIPYTLAINDPDCQVSEEEISFVVGAIAN